MNNQVLRLELVRRIAATNPGLGSEQVAALAAEIEATGAYEHDGQKIVPVGNRGQMAKASLLAPSLARALANEFVAACSADSSAEAAAFDRSVARARTLGVDFSKAIDGSDSDAGDFYGMTWSEISAPRGGSAA